MRVTRSDMHSQCKASTALPCPSRRSTGSRQVAAAGFLDGVKDFFERTKFENWAPRSSRAWRLRQYPSELMSKERQGAMLYTAPLLHRHVANTGCFHASRLEKHVQACTVIAAALAMRTMWTLVRHERAAQTLRSTNATCPHLNVSAHSACIQAIGVAACKHVHHHAEEEDFASSLENRIRQLSVDAQSVRAAPDEDAQPSFSAATDGDLAASLSDRIANSVDAEEPAAAASNDAEQPLEGTLPAVLLLHVCTCRVARCDAKSVRLLMCLLSSSQSAHCPTRQAACGPY